jgi:hypothetical protein
MPSAHAQYKWRTDLTCEDGVSDVQGEDNKMVEVVGNPVGRIKRGVGIHPKWLIPHVLAQYCLCMQNICRGGNGSAGVGVDMRVEVVGGPVGTIEWGDGVLTIDPRY